MDSGVFSKLLLEAGLAGAAVSTTALCFRRVTRVTRHQVEHRLRHARNMFATISLPWPNK